MDEQTNKKWYKSKLFYVPALIFIGMIMGSAMSTPADKSVEVVSPVKEVTTAPTQKVTVPSAEQTVIPTRLLTSTPIPTRVPTKVYVAPTKTYVAPTSTPYVAPTVQKKESVGNCNCSLTCPQMSSCAEAQYQLNTCGCSARDADDDGIACDGAPLHCQN